MQMEEHQVGKMPTNFALFLARKNNNKKLFCQTNNADSESMAPSARDEDLSCLKGLHQGVRTHSGNKDENALY